MVGRRGLLARLAAVSVVFIGWPGCSIPVAVDAINTSGAARTKHYYLTSGMKSVGRDDLAFADYAPQVRSALSSKGLIETPDPKRADIAIAVVYGEGDAEAASTVLTLPAAGTDGGDVKTYTASAWGAGEFSGGDTGSKAPVRTRVHSDRYRRHLVLYAIDLAVYRKSKRVRRIWQTLAATRSKHEDPRFMFRVLLAAMTDHIGGKTDRRIEIRLNKDGSFRHSPCGDEIGPARCEEILQKCGPPAPGMSMEDHIGFCKKAGKL